MIDDHDLDEVMPVMTNDINYFIDQPSENAIVPINQIQSLVQNKESSKFSKYQSFFFEFFIVEFNRRYDLRPRQGPDRPTKRVTFMSHKKKLLKLHLFNLKASHKTNLL